jgi:AcrR family transcriptional regulator
MTIRPRTQQQRRETTRQAVLESACTLFGSRGYQHTAIEDIATDCGTTIRPIYHYFSSKKNLFLVVTEHMEHQLFESLQTLKASENGRVSLGEYWEAFTSFSHNAAFRQIVLVDAPTVLGRDRWEQGPVVTLVIDLLCSLFPQLRQESRMLVARMVVAALTEAALALSEPGNTDKESAFEEVSGLIKTLTGFAPRQP